MGQQCAICGKKPRVGNRVAQRGKPKYLGGNGRKTTGITRRMFRPNLQKMRIQQDGGVVTRRVCTRCLRNGSVQKAVVRKVFSDTPVIHIATPAAEVIEETVDETAETVDETAETVDETAETVDETAETVDETSKAVEDEATD